MRVQIQDRLIAALRRYCQVLPDPRRGRNTTYAMADFALAAFAPFFMQSPSFLAHQRHLETGHGRSNCETLFGMNKIPGDSQVRAMLDPIDPALFYPLFADIVAELQQCGGLDAMRVLDGHVLIAWDGTEYHCSDTISCPNCSHRKRGKNKIEYFHTLLAATIVAPGHNRAVPLEPEFIVPQDGHDKQDCESRAVRRWLAAHAAQYARLKPVYLGDDLFSRQPICRAVLDEGAHFLFVCKPDSHPAIEEFRAGIKLDELTRKVRRGKQWATYRYQWLCDVPLRGDAKAMTVNWLMIEVLNADGRGDLSQQLHHRYGGQPGERRRTCRVWPGTLEDRERRFQHPEDQGLSPGAQFRPRPAKSSAVLATLNLLAFACHTVCDLGGRAWKAARRELVTRQGFFHCMRALTSYLVFPSWDHLLETLAFMRPPPLGP